MFRVTHSDGTPLERRLLLFEGSVFPIDYTLGFWMELPLTSTQTQLRLFRTVSSVSREDGYSLMIYRMSSCDLPYLRIEDAAGLCDLNRGDNLIVSLGERSEIIDKTLAQGHYPKWLPASDGFIGYDQTLCQTFCEVLTQLWETTVRAFKFFGVRAGGCQRLSSFKCVLAAQIVGVSVYLPVGWSIRPSHTEINSYELGYLGLNGTKDH